jgi:hypothetical protein
MNAPIYVASPFIHPGSLPPAQPLEVPDLLRQLIDLQRQQLELQKQQAAQSDEKARWTNFYGRWKDEFPELPRTCKQILPALERAYLGMLNDLSEKVSEDENDGLNNEFTLAELLDRYGVRLNQLASIVNQVGQLANLTPAE